MKNARKNRKNVHKKPGKKRKKTELNIRTNNYYTKTNNY